MEMKQQLRYRKRKFAETVNKAQNDNNIRKKRRPMTSFFMNMVGVTRFELVTSRPPDARATKLRYTPKT